MNEKLKEIESRVEKLENSLHYFYEGQMKMFIGMAKPCPHCGSTDLHLNYSSTEDNKIRYFVVCNQCKAAGGAHLAEHDAIIAWNKRG